MSINELEKKVETLKELEQFSEEINAEMESIKDQLKAEMLERDTEVLTCGKFICRWTSMISTRFDTRRFKEVFGEDLYKAYTKEIPSRKWSVA